MNKIDLLDLLPIVTSSWFREGTDTIEYRFLDDSYVEITYTLTLNGYYRVPPDSPDGMGDFIGGAEFDIIDTNGYDKDGNIIEVCNVKQFRNIICEKIFSL